MRPIPASPDASRGICDENRSAPQQRARFSPQVPDYPIPLNDCSLALPPLSEYGKEANERRRAGSGGNDGNAAGARGSSHTARGRSARASQTARSGEHADQPECPRRHGKPAHNRSTFNANTPRLLDSFASGSSTKVHKAPEFPKSVVSAHGNQPRLQLLCIRCQHPRTSGWFCRKWALISP